MKIIVDKIPNEPKECLFSELTRRGDRHIYICNLREYIAEADNNHTGYKPRCMCKCPKSCRFLKQIGEE